MAAVQWLWTGKQAFFLFSYHTIHCPETNCKFLCLDLDKINSNFRKHLEVILSSEICHIKHWSDFSNRFPGTMAILYDFWKRTCVVHWLSGKSRRTELMPKWGRTGKDYSFYTNFFFFFPRYPSCGRPRGKRKKRRDNATSENAQSEHSGRVDISRETTA